LKPHSPPDGPPVLAPPFEAAVARARAASFADGDAWARLADELDHQRGIRSWLRERSTPTRIACLASLSVAVLLLNLLAMPRPDLGVVPTGRLVLDVVLHAVPLAVAWVLVLRPLQRSQSSPAAWATGLAAVAAVVVVASLPAAHADHPASLAGVGEDFVARARGCFSFGTAMAIPVLVLGRGLMRDDAPAWHVAGLLAATVALVGSLSLYLHCPIVAPAHLWAGHVTVLVPFFALAIWARVRG
jgi:hypothetical protein